MQKRSQHNNDERTQFFRKNILLTLYSKWYERVTKGLCVRGELETEQRLQHIDPSSSGSNSTSGGARGVMVIVVGSGHGDTSSNPGRD